MRWRGNRRADALDHVLRQVGDHVRAGHAGGDRVHADVVAPKLAREAAGQAVDGEFAGRIAHAGGLAVDADHRAGVDDRAAALRLHNRRDGAAAVEHGRHVQIHDVFERGRVILVERLARGNARVVHQNVDAAKGLGDLRHGGFHRGVIGQVGRKTHDVPIRVFGLELGQRLVHRLLTRAEERDGRAVFEERFHNGKADAAVPPVTTAFFPSSSMKKYASCTRPDEKRTSDLYN